MKGVDKVKGLVSSLIVRFKIGSEDHKLWVEKRETQNAVMMASKPDDIRKKIEEFERQLPNIPDKTQQEITVSKIKKLKDIITKLETNKDESNGRADLNVAIVLVSDIYKSITGVSKVVEFNHLGISQITKNSMGNIIMGELDELGRPTGVMATLTQNMIGTGSAASSTIRPPGFGGQVSGHARGHLLGNQLGGSGKDARNLVTLYQNPVNSPVMRDFEKSVRKAIEAGETVRYQSIPIYEGSNLIPSGVTIRARGTGGFRLDVTILNRR